MTPEERVQILSRKSEAQRQYILAKVREYEALRSDERELRLRLVQLHWWLVPLLRTAPTNRVERMNSIPEPDRSIILERLAQWDRLPAETQKEILEHEATLQHLIQFRAGGPSDRKASYEMLPPEQRRQLEEKLLSWQALSPERRQKMLGYFEEFFDLQEEEKARTLNALSASERSQMDETLRAFRKLPAAQRRVCLDSFHKFANMSVQERAEFLRNAERWQTMTPAERQSWRSLVAQLPPLPPGLGEPPALPMPRARALRLPPDSPMVTSNTVRR